MKWEGADTWTKFHVSSGLNTFVNQIFRLNKLCACRTTVEQEIDTHVKAIEYFVIIS